MRKPGHSDLALQLPWASTCPDSSFQGVGTLSCISSKFTTLPPYSLAFPSTPAPHFKQDIVPMVSGIALIFSLAPSTWLGLAVLAKGHQSQASACDWPPWPPACDCPRFRLSPLLWVFPHLILPVLHPFTFCNVLWTFYYVFLPISQGQLGGRGTLILPFLSCVRNPQKPP